jgi:arylsulfatase A-like enzyme
MTDRVIGMLDVIREYRTPFFLHVSYLEPHPPYFAPAPFDTLVDPAKVKLPEGGGPESPAWQQIVREQSGTSLATEADIRKMIAVYYGMIGYADSQMARLFEELGRRSMLENTWIIISSDHGDYTGEKGLFMKTESLYECLLHVPLIIRPPDGVRASHGERIDGLVSLVDLFPSILNLAGVKTPEYAQGRDLVAWANTANRSALRDCVFSQVGDYHGSNLKKSTFPSGIPAAGRHPGLLEGARSLEFSFIKDPDYGDEAYDLRSDPKELRNLLEKKGAEPAAVTELRRLTDDWREHCVKLRDRLGVIPGYRGWEEGQ